MNKTEFNELICYIANRPKEAERLRMVLMGKSECKQTDERQNLRQADQWMKASEVGELMGMSARWVKDHMPLLPEGTYRKADHGRGKKPWIINVTLVGDQLKRMKY